MPEAPKNLIEDVREVIDITSRVDERIKMIAETQHHLNSRLNQVVDQLNTLAARVHVMETVGPANIQTTLHDLTSRVKTLEDHKQTFINRTRAIMGYVWQGIFIVFICYLLYRLGLNAPPVP